MSFLQEPKAQVSLSSALIASSQMRAQASAHLSGVLKQKCPLTCKKDKKHQAFELIFICIEKECQNSLQPICAQCLHESHSGHEVKLIKELAESAEAFINSERRKKQVSSYWEQLSVQYEQMYEELGGLVRYLQGVQSTLKRVHEEFFAKLNKEKEAFWEEIQESTSNILNGECSSKEELLQKVRLILKSVKLDDLENPQYRINVLREETVFMVSENYQSIDQLVKQIKQTIISTLSEREIENSYDAAEFRITEGNDYLKIASQQQNKTESRIVEVEEEGEKQEQIYIQDTDFMHENELEDFDIIRYNQDQDRNEEDNYKNLNKNNETSNQQKEEKETQKRKITAQEIRMKYCQKEGNSKSDESIGIAGVRNLTRIQRQTPQSSYQTDSDNQLFGKYQPTSQLRNEFTFTHTSQHNPRTIEEGQFDLLSFSKNK